MTGGGDMPEQDVEGHEVQPTDSFLHHFWHEIIATPGGLTAISVIVAAVLGYLGIRYKRKSHGST